MTTLADLQVMAQATVLAVDGQDEISLRLLEMGLTPGTPVTVSYTHLTLQTKA